ncbi:MAG: N-acetylmuramoyl-L-alanine amidase [Vicinamibacteraceae bacterium]
MARLTFFAPARRAVCAAAVALAVAGSPIVAGASARSDYERLVTRVETMRLDGPRPSPRPQMRRVAADAEALARRHAGSGYADNALWQAATVALAAFRVYRNPADRTLGVELLDALVKRYPSSSLVPEARGLLRRHSPAPGSAKATGSVAASARPTPPPASSSVGPASVGPASVGPVSTPVGFAAPGAGAKPSVALTPVSVRGETAAAANRPAETTGRLATLRGVRRSQIGETIRLTLDFDGEVAFDQQRLPGPDRVFFDFARTAPIAALDDTVLQFEGPAVRRVRLGRPRADVTRLAIDLDGVATYTVFALYHPFRLTIDLEPAGLARPASPATLTSTRAPHAPAPVPVPRIGVVPTPVSLPATMAAPAPPPLAPLRAHRLTAPSIVRPMPTPTSVVVNEPPLAVDDTELSPGRLRGSVAAAPALATRVVSRPPALLRARRTQPLMLRAAVRPPSGLPPGLDLASYVVPTGRHARVDRRAAAPAPLVPLVPSAPAENGSGGFSIARQLGLGVSRIVIDPGHGGKDPGAPGSKTTEAEVVLDVALRVEKLLAAEIGIEVVLTRRTDTFVQLEERTAMANRHAADLFLSIHANSSRNRKAAGVETYILNFATSADAAAVAARENAAAAGSMRNLPDMVRAITQGNKRDESRELATAVQEAMVSRLRPHNPPLRDLGVKQAPFVVLIGAGMPSVLAEIAFISHDGEGGLLRTEKYRQRIADALAAAILRYTRTLKPVGTVASQ